MTKKKLKPLTILMMTNTYAPILGGLEKSIRLFSSAIRRRGHRVVVVAPAHDGAPKREAHVLRVPAIRNFSGTDFSVNLPIPGALSKVIDRIRPDVLHAHHPFLMGDMALRLAGQHHVPLVFTNHTLFNEFCYLPPPMNADPMKRFVAELAVGYANLCDHVIAPSQSIRDLLRSQGVKRPITVVPTGMEEALFRLGHPAAIRRRHRIPGKAFVVGHAGRLSPEKNLEFLSGAVIRFLVREPKAHFLLVGAGPSEALIRKAFAGTDARRRVHYAGILKGKDLLSAYQAMDVFAFASQSETQGMVVTEAMASGVPVVAVDAPGVREVVSDGRNGRLLEHEDQAEFCEALAWVKRSDVRRRAKLRAAARNTARKFSLDLCVTRELEIYRRVRRRRTPLDRGEHPWRSVMGRVRTELALIANMGKATGAAIFETSGDQK